MRIARSSGADLPLHGPGAPGSGGAPRTRDLGDVLGRADAFFRRVRRGVFPPSDPDIGPSKWCASARESQTRGARTLHIIQYY